LLERLAAGDRQALARVTRMVTACLRRMGAYDLGDEHQDICQEVAWALVRAVRASRTPAPEKTQAYVAGVVRNQFVSWLRRRGAESGGVAAATPGDCKDVDELPAGGCVGAASGNGSDESRLTARRALARLPVAMQSLLVAHYVEGSTVEMLVAAGSGSRATLNRELKRAREAFRRALLDDREAWRESGSAGDGHAARAGADGRGASHLNAGRGSATYTAAGPAAGEVARPDEDKGR
jgi:DNA-directed RNA polymerase specialized sigma24 family protein